MMKQFAIWLLIAGWSGIAAQTRPPASGQVIPLWESAAPGALGEADSDRPTVTVYRPSGGARNTGTAVVIAPGGGYSGLATAHEGVQEANWFNAMGVTAFVLKYRLGPRYHHPIELGDAQRAIRIVRSRAAEFNLQPDRIGMMGFSAGGHLTATAGTRFDAGNADAADPVDRAGSRPDFLVLAYPVISFDPSITHAGSVRNLLGDNPDPKLIQELSAELQVTAQTPPTFIYHTTDDDLVPVEASVAFYRVVAKAGVPVEMHLFAKGKHGSGLGLGDPALDQWSGLLEVWLRGRGLLQR